MDNEGPLFFKALLVIRLTVELVPKRTAPLREIYLNL